MTLLADLLATQGASTGNTVEVGASRLIQEAPDALYDFSFLDTLVAPNHSTDWFVLSETLGSQGYEGLLVADNSPWSAYQQVDLDLEAALQAYRSPLGQSTSGLVLDVPLTVSGISPPDVIMPTLWAAPTQMTADAAHSIAAIDDSLFQTQHPAPQAICLNQMLDVQEVSNVAAEMSRYGVQQSMTLATVEDVSYAPALMQIIAGDW